MALSEGLKGFVKFFTDGFNNGEEDPDTFKFGDGIEDLYGDDVDGTLALDKDYTTTVRPTRTTRTTDKVTSLPNSSYKTGEVTVIEPRSFSESAQIVKKLHERKTVILHLDLLDKEQSQRTIDFVCGATHALNGTAQKISEMVFIFTPSTVALSVETGATQSKFAESLWNKPL